MCYHHHLQEGGVAWLNVSLLHLSPALVPRAQLNPRSRHRGPELFPVATIILLVSIFAAFCGVRVLEALPFLLTPPSTCL